MTHILNVLIQNPISADPDWTFPMPGAGVGFVIMVTLAIGPQRDITEIKI